MLATIFDKYGRITKTYDCALEDITDETQQKTYNVYVNNKLDTHIDSYTDTTVKYTYDSCGELQQVTEKLGNTLICQVME